MVHELKPASIRVTVQPIIDFMGDEATNLRLSFYVAIERKPIEECSAQTVPPSRLCVAEILPSARHSVYM